MLSAFYFNTIESFLEEDFNSVFGKISSQDSFETNSESRGAWKHQIKVLQKELVDYSGEIYFEFSIPRMGKRVDCILIIEDIVFVIEFKVGESDFKRDHYNQVWDYALDLKNFHEISHQALLIPVLIATKSINSTFVFEQTSHNDGLLKPVFINDLNIKALVKEALVYFKDEIRPGISGFLTGRYSPTPTIIEAALSLYQNHSVHEITRNDAHAVNLKATVQAVCDSINYAKLSKKKVICFVTGVPGAGKTLVGLNVATLNISTEQNNASVFLSGNAPLVSVLQEALARNRVVIAKSNQEKITKAEAKSSVKAFIQIIHHYRDEYLKDKNAPFEKIAIFDEAQRAWNKEMTIDFMRRKKDQPNFQFSEPEFLISCLDRHQDWATVICLVGGGQEINTGEAGIAEWLRAIQDTFRDWEVHISPNLYDSEYNARETLIEIEKNCIVNYKPSLHLSHSMRSFRADKVSSLVKSILDINIESAQSTLKQVLENYPIVLTRNLSKAKTWLKEKARANERYGMVVSSQAQRLRPLAIDVRAPMNPVHWFLNDSDDIRSSYYLEDVATEFQVQGLELDWVCITWDGDLRFIDSNWKSFSFKGNKWQNINKEERKRYLINAYRVLLTRARSGMVIVVPEGSIEDPTRNPAYYNGTYNYLAAIGIPIL